jgi:hypothetical protein
MITDGEDLRTELLGHWDRYSAAMEGLTQLARAPLLQAAEAGPSVTVRIRVYDVLPKSIYDILADERPRSFVDEIFKKRLWVGRGLVATLGEAEARDSSTVQRLQAMREGDVVAVKGHLSAWDFPTGRGSEIVSCLMFAGA